MERRGKKANKKKEIGKLEGGERIVERNIGYGMWKYGRYMYIHIRYRLCRICPSPVGQEMTPS